VVKSSFGTADYEICTTGYTNYTLKPALVCKKFSRQYN